MNTRREYGEKLKPECIRAIERLFGPEDGGEGG